MQIVFNNEGKKRVHVCNVCGKQDIWTNTWRAIEFSIGIGYRGHDVEFLTCSEQCIKQDEENELCAKYRNKLHTEWWQAYEDLVEPADKKFKKIFENIK